MDTHSREITVNCDAGEWIYFNGDSCQNCDFGRMDILSMETSVRIVTPGE